MACASREQPITASAAATGAAISAAAAMACAVIRTGRRASSIAMAQCAGAGYVLTLERNSF